MDARTALARVHQQPRVLLHDALQEVHAEHELHDLGVRVAARQPLLDVLQRRDAVRELLSVAEMNEFKEELRLIRSRNAKAIASKFGLAGS